MKVYFLKVKKKKKKISMLIIYKYLSFTVVSLQFP